MGKKNKKIVKDFNFFTAAPDNNFTVAKNIICTNICEDLATRKTISIGIDEAGRGPVLGYMVFGAMIIDEGNIKKVSGIDLRDSKMLKPNERMSSYEQIKKSFSYMYYALHPEYISTEMDRRTLNDLSVSAVVLMLKEIFKVIPLNNESESVARTGTRTRDVKVFIDSLGNSPRYYSFIKSLFPEITLTIQPKADSLFKCVSGASIIAKVVRDGLIDDLCCSGYPSDERTYDYLRKHKSSPLIRYKWKSVQNDKRSGVGLYGKYDTLYFSND